MAETVLAAFGETLVQTGFVRRYDASRGYSTDVTYEGTIESVQAAEASLAGTGTPYVADYGNPPVARMTVSTPDIGETNADPNAILLTTMELQANTSQRSLYEHRKALALPKDTIRVIKDALKKNTAPSITLTGDALLLYNHLLNGQDSFLSSQFVFKVNQYVSRKAIVSIAFSDVGKVYSNVDLKNEMHPTPLFVTAIDEAFLSVKNGVYNGAAPSGFTLGWLKHAPTITSVADNKAVIQFEYWLDAWSDFDYA